MAPRHQTPRPRKITPLRAAVAAAREAAAPERLWLVPEIVEAGLLPLSDVRRGLINGALAHTQIAVNRYLIRDSELQRFIAACMVRRRLRAEMAEIEHQQLAELRRRAVG